MVISASTALSRPFSVTGVVCTEVSYQPDSMLRLTGSLPDERSAEGARRPFTLELRHIAEVELVTRGGPSSGRPVYSAVLGRAQDVSWDFDDPLLFDYGPSGALFGTAPLPDPYRFLLEFSRLVRDDLRIDRDPIKYLNWRGGVNEWLEGVYSRASTLVKGPLVLLHGAALLLDAQVADYHLVPDEEPSAGTDEAGSGDEQGPLGERAKSAASLGVLRFPQGWAIGRELLLSENGA